MLLEHTLHSNMTGAVVNSTAYRPGTGTQYLIYLGEDRVLVLEGTIYVLTDIGYIKVSTLTTDRCIQAKRAYQTDSGFNCVQDTLLKVQQVSLPDSGVGMDRSGISGGTVTTSSSPPTSSMCTLCLLRDAEGTFTYSTISYRGVS